MNINTAFYRKATRETKIVHYVDREDAMQMAAEYFVSKAVNWIKYMWKST